MTTPDLNIVTVACNIVTFLILWFRKDKKAAKYNALILSEHKRMYADYKVLHDIKENGGIDGQF